MSLTLRHLNDDTSWLIIFDNFKILLDPWLCGSQIDYFHYFSRQEHAIQPSIQNITRDLNIEIDAIIISHEFTDHCHEETLRSLSSTIPIYATTNAAKRIRRWNYFQYVYNIPILNNQSQLNISDRIRVGYIEEKGFLSLPSLHGATCISFLIDNQQWHSLLYIPHGCEQTSICEWFNKQSNVSICILLQGFDRVFNPIWLGGLLNYGCNQAAKLAIALKVKHWIGTHDENKIASGLVSLFLKRHNYTIDDAKLELKKYKDENIIPNLHHIQNGNSITIDLIE
ncbi:unnamed protein product [Adineta steineri]|uniref:Metallo-beta-lactamase domain-containing protein n=1 Tax=Adineta steineri TaxID=433720 RepID=A0A814TWJ5_9BILA|nr:unnamed protein product [Adineta steineri]CAF3869074.1 unnamed protein product [Adineta steineri]